MDNGRTDDRKTFGVIDLMRLRRSANYKDVIQWKYTVHLPLLGRDTKHRYIHLRWRKWTYTVSLSPSRYLFREVMIKNIKPLHLRWEEMDLHHTISSHLRWKEMKSFSIIPSQYKSNLYNIQC